MGYRFGTGADDYVTGNLLQRVQARVKALLRRSQPMPVDGQEPDSKPQPIQIRGLGNCSRRLRGTNGEELDLTHVNLNFCIILASHAGQGNHHARTLT